MGANIHRTRPAALRMTLASALLGLGIHGPLTAGPKPRPKASGPTIIHRQPLDRRLALGAWRLAKSEAPSAKRRRIPAKTGVLRVDYPEFWLKLLGPDGAREVSGRDGQAVLPANTYALLEWILWARGTDGRIWKVSGGMGTADVVITPRRVATLRLATPLKMEWGLVKSGNPYWMELKIRGTSGEECCGVTVDGQMTPPPRFEVRDAAGQNVGSGTVRICCKFRASAEWTRDATTLGRFTVHATADWGPFPVEMGQPLTLEVKAPAAPEPGAAVGSPAPDLRLPPTEGGSAVSLSALRDLPVALCFFCGCAPCLEVAQGIARLTDTHTVAVVTDAESFRGDALRRFRATTSFRGSVLLDRDGAIARRYRAITCPRVWIIDRDGRLVFGTEDAHAEPSQILAGVNAALAPLRSDRLSKQ